jgi:RNA polymerase sigma-70 factor, ECF subfamily
MAVSSGTWCKAMNTGPSFETLARPWMDAAYNLAFWILRNREDAEDAVQEGYLRAYRAFSGFRGEAMRPWLLAIVRNAALRIGQRRRRASAMFAADSIDMRYLADLTVSIASPEPAADQKLVVSEEIEQLYAAIADLPDAYREIVVLRDLEGLSYQEIAAVIGVPAGTVMSRLARGRAALKKALIEREGEGDAV